MLRSSALLEQWERNIRTVIKMRTTGPALQNLLMVRERGRWGKQGKKKEGQTY